MRMDRAWKLVALIVVILGMVTSARAQEPATREAAIEQEQSDKVQDLHPYVPGRVKQFMNRDDRVLTIGLRWHPFCQNAYSQPAPRVQPPSRAFEVVVGRPLLVTKVS